jgi:hypothetical protein
MENKKHETDGFKEFLAKHKAVPAQVSRKKQPINTSKYTLPEQIERFENFSHTQSEFEAMKKEISLL